MTTQQTARYTPGPWGWRGRAKGGPIELIGLHGNHPYVMQFARHGMQGGQPVFPVDDGRMMNASDLAVQAVSYADRVIDINAPNARLIALAPRMADALRAVDFAASHSGLPDAISEARAILAELDA